MLYAYGPTNIVVLIFGGCCANVFALEALIQSEPDSGVIITFLQFFFTALAAYSTQYSSSAPYTIRSPGVPIRRWAILAAMHFGINMLNNWAFSYRISVPVHIILRSFGSVTTMAAGFLRGKKYSFLQVLSVVLLTVGVVVSAWADAEGKGKSMSFSMDSFNSDFGNGLLVLLVAQFLSAYMGTYTEDTYAIYGANWKESLFYSHFLSLPLFLPLAGVLRKQYSRLLSTSPLDIKALARSSPTLEPLLTTIRRSPMLTSSIEGLPQGVVFMLVNILTQLACITGVNLLCAKSSAVTVTIVLNIRKLVSFILSTVLFGHQLSGMMILGSTLVFGSGALYGYETSWRLPQQKQTEGGKANGQVKKD
ncbi:UAA transporter [Neohortaea acidophila]|uniref:UAA transporter n=1 Tax=Neohortaea acidophila TaxID=245834 RepID=A0A6A6PMY0_9PEZI|nr:UAA transporter [Neohortaea acidophila]KAF2480617.1 UAA transporter [Neohortaea acidophila]